MSSVIVNIANGSVELSKVEVNVKEALMLTFFLVILASGSLFSVHLLRCIPCCCVASFLPAEKTIERPSLFCNDHDPTYKTDIACVCIEKPKFDSTTALNYKHSICIRKHVSL